MAWTDEVHEHRAKVERGRERLRARGVDFSDENKTSLLPLGLMLATIAGLFWWHRDGQHKLKRSAFPGAQFLKRLLAGGNDEDVERRRERAAKAADRRLKEHQGASGSGQYRAGIATQSRSFHEKPQRKKTRRGRRK